MRIVPPAAERSLAFESGPGAATRPRARVARLYAVYAAGFLVVTLLSGLWLRTVFVAPGAIGNFRFPFALHAHSHVAFFGWTTMAMFAVIAARLAGSRSTMGLRIHAHLVGVASAAAFVGFLQTGYAAGTIALSILHVVLWIAFVFAVWPWLDDFAPVERRYWRGALVYLVIAGLGAMTPGIVMARGIGDPWINQISIKSFLTPFTSGWLLLGVMGAVYAAIERRRCAAWVFWLMAVGVLPSTLLHTTAAPPAEWLTLVGQSGTALVGLAALLFAADVLLSRGAPPLLRVAGAAAAVKGGAEVLVSAGLLMELMGSRQITIAYLHLVLLGLVTPALVATALGVEAAPRRVAAYAAGLALMVASLGVIGWPAVGMLAMRVGLDAGVLFKVALAGGALCAAAGVSLLRSASLRERPARLSSPAPRKWGAGAGAV